MRSKFLLIALGATVAGCQTSGRPDVAASGLPAVNIPVVTSADYVFDAPAPGGSLSAADAGRLDGWFQGLGLGYGDTIYVDGSYAPAARSQVAAIAARYGMLVSAGAPVTAGMIPPGSARVVVARRRAVVPNCPNWSQASQPDLNNKTTSNFGCSVNANLAEMVADPQDLVHGREGSGVGDPVTGAKAVNYYRSLAPSGSKGLADVAPKGGN